MKFKKINLILIALIGVGIVSLLFKVAKQEDEFVVVDVLGSGKNGWWVESSQVPSWLVDSIKNGSTELSFSGKKIAEVLGIQSYEEGSNKIMNLTVRLKVISDKKRGTYRYKQKPLEVGSVIEMLLDNSRVYGSVVRIRNEKNETKDWVYKKVKVKLYERRPWLAESIEVGDKVVDKTNGEIQSEILLKKVELSEVSIPTSRGLVLARDPVLRDVEIDLRLLVNERVGVFYFANYQPVKIGNKLYIPMEDYNLYEAEVMSVEDDRQD